MLILFLILSLVGVFSCKGCFTSYTGHVPTNPVNLEELNTEFDEYRTMIFEEEVDYQRYMMLFLSDRPRGKGGFDLYYVGVSKDVEIP